MNAPIHENRELALFKGCMSFWTDYMAAWIRRRDWVFCNLDLCESPIERLLFIPMMFWESPRVKIIGDRSPGGCSGYDDTLGGTPTLFIEPQARIGDCRVDFLLTPTGHGRTGRLIVLECDGHDYHERTKEQATRDRQRDRSMIGADYIVLRFTGSEIYREPRACAAQVETFVTGEMLALG